jgi:hypothetical protein
MQTPDGHSLILVHVPVRDIGIDTFAAGLAVGREGGDLIIAFDLPVLSLLNRSGT